MKNLHAILIITAITLLVFANSLGNGFVYDDVHFVQKNDSIRSLGNIPSFFTSVKSFSSKGEFFVYRPLSTLSYAMDYFIWKLNPAGYHLSSLLWHLLNGIMLYYLMLMILGDAKASLLAALLFAVHPVQTETVAWISQRSNLICIFFYLLSMFLWLEYTAGRDWKYYAGAVGAFGLALMGKEMAITLPLVLALYGLLSGRGKEKKPGMKLYIPFFITGILYVLLRTIVLGRVSGQNEFVGGSIFIAVLTMIKATGLYIKLLVFPAGLCVEHYFPPVVTPGILVIGALALVGGLLYLAVRLSRNSGKVAFFIFWFFLTLIPVSNIIPLQDVIIAERFLYLPSIGFCAVLALIYLKLQSAGGGLKRAALLLLLLVPLYSYASARRNPDWKDSLSLCTSTLKRNPSSYRSRNGLGLVYLDKGLYKKAISEFEEVIRLKPGYVIAHNNLAMAYEKSGEMEKAGQIYGRIKNTDYYADEIRFNSAEGFHNRGLYEEAVAGYMEVLKINPNHAKTHNNLACIYLGKGQENEAIEEFSKAVECDPAFFEGYYNLGAIALKKGQHDKALGYFREVLRLKPDYLRAYNASGGAYAAIKMTRKAEEAYKKAIEISPGSPEAYNNLGVLYNNSGKYEAAAGMFKKAIEIKPGFAAAHNGLGAAYWGLGEKEKAEAEIMKAIEFDPGLTEAKNNLELLRKYK